VARALLKNAAGMDLQRLSTPRLLPSCVALLGACAFSALACGGVPDAGASGCWITDLTGKSTSVTYDASSGRLATHDYVYDIDETARTIAVSFNEPSGIVWYWTDTFDEIGHRVHLEHRDGTLVDYANSYDGERILRTEVTPTGGQSIDPGTVEYFYEDAENRELWTRQESVFRPDESLRFTWLRTIERGHVVRAEQHLPDETTTNSVWTSTFDGDLLATVERDSGFYEGADGTPDIRFSWLRDSDGNLTAFEQDGTDHADNPVIDGEPDIHEGYSPACSDLLTRFPWLAHLPDRDETTPGFRSATVWRPDPTR